MITGHFWVLLGPFLAQQSGGYRRARDPPGPRVDLVRFLDPVARHRESLAGRAHGSPESDVGPRPV